MPYACSIFQRLFKIELSSSRLNHNQYFHISFRPSFRAFSLNSRDDDQLLWSFAAAWQYSFLPWPLTKKPTVGRGDEDCQTATKSRVWLLFPSIPRRGYVLEMYVLFFNLFLHGLKNMIVSCWDPLQANYSQYPFGLEFYEEKERYKSYHGSVRPFAMCFTWIPRKKIHNSIL